MQGKITFRVINDSDKAFLKKMYADSRAWEFELTHWSDKDRDDFLNSQFETQDKVYKSNYIGAVHRIIQLDSADIGRLIVSRSDDLLHIVDLTILSSHQGRGLGGDILKSLINEAQGGKVPVTLSVEKSNPAINLYRRLGFQPTGVSGHHISMKWEPFLGNREI
jgi:ribosomal protein S18 acetylase RimI-like enzyme